MYFGEYLVSNEIIDEATLLDCLIYQKSNLPCETQIVFEQKILTEAEMLNVLNNQERKGITFKESCESLCLWSNEIQGAINGYFKKFKIPLGQVLIQKGIIDFECLTKALDNFLLKVVSPEKDLVETVSAVQNEKISVLPRVGFLNTYELCLSVNRERLVFELLSSLSEKIKEGIEGGNLQERLTMLYKEFRVIFGAASFVNFDLSKNLLSVLCVLLEQFNDLDVEKDHSELLKGIDLVSSGFILLLEINRIIKMIDSEELFECDNESMEGYRLVCTKIENLIRKNNHRG